MEKEPVKVGTAILSVLESKQTPKEENPKLLIATDNQILSALNTLATIKRISNITTPDAAGAFFNIHLRGLRGFSMAAIQAAVDHFCFNDDRDGQNKPFFPQPDELIKIVKQETDSILWKIEHGKKIREETERAMNGQKVIEEIKTDPLEGFDKSQVVRICRLITDGMDLELAKNKILSEDGEINY